MSIVQQPYDDVDDVIDLSQDYCTAGSDDRSSSRQYRISLHSIDDDELRLFHRNLVTPAPSVCGDEDSILKSMIRHRYVPPSRVQRPISRGESVMLFKKINNGDKDVSFDDLVSSELRDFLDTDFMMDEILSRPVSRATITRNASKIQDINRFRTSVQGHSQQADLPSRMRTLSIQDKRQIPSKNNSLHFRNPSVPESYRHHRTPVAALSNSRDDYLHKQTPKKSVTMIPKQSSPKPTRLATKASYQSLSPPQRKQTSAGLDSSSSSLNNTKNVVRRRVFEPIVTTEPRFISRRLSFAPRSAAPSSSDEEEQFTASHQRSYSSSTTTADNVFHRYNSSSKRGDIQFVEHKSLSSPRLRTMSSHRTLPIVSSHTATTTTAAATTPITILTNENAVIDSAKQVLASIRERRKRSMLSNGSL